MVSKSIFHLVFISERGRESTRVENNGAAMMEKEDKLNDVEKRMKIYNAEMSLYQLCGNSLK